ncbi:MAG: hypothetical protein A3F46_00185 [Legionellales bacterium RIFCSPHIGHO2_12_FULL_42_9]|nr:MAG: hypothetical protein A3F46_00185 [Legionellales bacterium RIFCSPHIGHO2_12_FULL_42_9]
MSLLNDMLNDLNSRPIPRPQILQTSSLSRHGLKQLSNAFCWFTIIGMFLFFIYVLIYGKQLSTSPITSLDSEPTSSVGHGLVNTLPSAPAVLTSVIAPAPIFEDEEISDYVDESSVDTVLSESYDELAMDEEKIKLSPDEWHDEQLNAALEALEAGAEQRATDLLTLILTRFPASIEVRENLAGIYLSQGALDEAVTVLNEGLSYESHNLNLTMMKARVLVEQGKHREALALLLQFNPDINKSTEYYALLAALFESLGRINEAGSVYQTLIKLDPTNGQYWLGLGIALESKHSLQQAMEAYKRASQSENIQPAVRSYAENRLNSLQG